jgi:hypothetical protein
MCGFVLSNFSFAIKLLLQKNSLSRPLIPDFPHLFAISHNEETKNIT